MNKEPPLSASAALDCVTCFRTIGTTPPLYRIEVLTSDADTLMSSPSKASKEFLLSKNDTEETQIARRITIKAKAKEVVRGRGRQGMEVKIMIGDPKATMQRKKTKRMLLQEMIKAAHDHNTPSDGESSY